MRVSAKSSRAWALAVVSACAAALPARAEHAVPGWRVAQAPAEPPPAAAPADALFELEEAAPAAGFPDPLESSNRRLLWFDEQLDRWAIGPTIDVYQFLVPGPVRKTVRRFFRNLDSPALLVNDLLQREWSDAGVTIERFVLNTTFGLGGLFDPAARLGLPRHQSDFGQTLALAGVDSGPYLVLPFFGPSNVRDAFGGLVDLALQPTVYILPFLTLIMYEGSVGLSVRDEHAEALELLRESSVDYYSALRNAYYQNRMAQIWERREYHRPDPPPAAPPRAAGGGAAARAAASHMSSLPDA